MRSRTAIITLLTTVLVATIAVASPAALALIDLGWKPDWRHLADIGQAYGAASAIFSALAVAGVAASLIYQARALRLARIQAIRSTHRELLTHAMSQPEIFAPAVGFKSWKATSMKPEQYWFTTAFVGYLHSAFDAGIHTEKTLRNSAFPNLFASEMGRQWWKEAGRTWRNNHDSSKRRFARVADEAYTTAVAAGPPLPASTYLYDEPSTTRLDPEQASGWPESRAGTTLAVLVATAAVAGWLIGRRR